MDRSRRSVILSVLFLILFCGLIYFKDLEVPFYTDGEPREAVVVQEIIHSGEWILPLRNGAEIPSKPPLFHWLGAVVSGVFGRVDEFTVRVPSALMATLGVLFTFVTGCRFWRLKAGLFSALILATGFEWWRAATSARVDMTLTFFLVTAFFVFFHFYEDGAWRRPHAYMFFSACALAVLTKGPVGLIVPLLAVMVFLLLVGNLAFWKKSYLWEGGLLFLMVVCSWYGLALWREGEAFFDKQILRENLLRFIGSNAPHQQPFYYFLPYPFLSMLPWSLFFLPLAVFLYSHRRRLVEEKLLFPIVWAATVLCFYSLSSGKRAVYLLPLYPPLALLLGAWWSSFGERKASAIENKMLRLGLGLCFFSLLFFLTFIVFRLSGASILDRLRPFLLSDPANLIVFTGEPSTLLPAFSLWIVLTGATALFLLVAIKRSWWDGLFVAFASFTTVSLVIIGSAFYPLRAREHTMKPFMEKVVQEVDQQSPLFFYRSFDYGALFYAGRRIPPAPQDLPREAPVFLLMWEEEWHGLSALDSTGMEMIATSDGTAWDDSRRLALVRTRESLPKISLH
jgi:4-amino-4-deoxy-L-arabinose transferase-like glycosyltransferase